MLNKLSRYTPLIVCCAMVLFKPDLAYGKKNGVDPTKPPSFVKIQKSPEQVQSISMRLTAIFVRDQNLYAVIDEKIVKEGDVIKDMIVQSITPKQVSLVDEFGIKEEVKLSLHSIKNEEIFNKQVMK